MYQPLAECGDYILNLYVEQEGELGDKFEGGEDLRLKRRKLGITKETYRINITIVFRNDGNIRLTTPGTIAITIGHFVNIRFLPR